MDGDARVHEQGVATLWLWWHAGAAQNSSDKLAE